RSHAPHRPRRKNARVLARVEVAGVLLVRSVFLRARGLSSRPLRTRLRRDRARPARRSGKPYARPAPGRPRRALRRPFPPLAALVGYPWHAVANSRRDRAP